MEQLRAAAPSLVNNMGFGAAAATAAPPPPPTTNTPPAQARQQQNSELFTQVKYYPQKYSKPIIYTYTMLDNEKNINY